MAKKSEMPPFEVVEKTVTVYEMNGVEYRLRSQVDRVILVEKLSWLLDRPDGLPNYDIGSEQVVEWIIDHLDELVALKQNSDYGEE